jgi:acetylornithine/succinyldiaminopimelate/putrescine aminotransferase
VQTGIGRLGTLFGYEAFGVEPDVMTLAKGLGGGVPIGAFLTKKHAAVLTPGDHGTTFGGNPLACAVASTVVDYVLKRKVLANAKKSGARLTKGLQKLQKKHKFVTEVRGQGLLQAIQFKDDISSDVLTAAIKHGLLVNAPRPNTLRFMPSLVITSHEVNEGVKRLDKAIAEVAKAKGLK